MEKKKNRKIVWIALSLLILSGVLLYRFFMPYVDLGEKKIILEKGESYRFDDFVVSSNGEIIEESEYLDTEKTGIHEYSYQVKKAFFAKEYTLSYEVIDTTPPDLKVISETVSFEPGHEYTIEDVLKNISYDEGEIAFETDLNPSFPGNYTVRVFASDEAGNTAAVSYVLIIEDREAPFVFDDGDGKKILKGSSFDIRDLISYGDNADPNPLLEVEGKVNTSRIGTYPLRVTLSDSSGNRTEWQMHVKVVAKEDPYEYEEDEPYLFSDMKEDLKGENRKYGVDVSEWQGDIDFEKLKKAGCEFVIMRIGFSRNGTLHIDKSFHDNLSGAKSVGLPVGIYYYSNDRSKEDVVSVFRQISAELGDQSLELPIVFDWENFSYYQEYGLSFRDLNELYDVFEKEALQRGMTPMLYGSKYYLEHVFSDLDSRNVWLAHYVDESSYAHPYRFWQVCAWGRIDGIEENVDFDVMFAE